MRQGPWFQQPISPLEKGGSVLVIGMGLAGTTTARFLADQGLQVTIFDAHQGASMGTSGNPAGVVFPYVAQEDDSAHRFYTLAYALAHHLIGAMEREGASLDRQNTGALHLLCKKRLVQIHQYLSEGRLHPFARAIESQEANRIAGMCLDAPALFYPHACSLNPAALCRQLIKHPSIQARVGCRVEGLTFDGRFWHLEGAAGQHLAQAQVVVLANAHEAVRLAQCEQLPLRTTIGQLALVPGKHHSNVIVCHRDYLIPNVENHTLIGATWRPDHPGEPVMLASDQAKLIAGCNRALPLDIPDSPLKGRVARRCATPDHLPMVGPLPDHGAFSEAYHDLHLGKRKDFPPGPNYPGLYVSLAHGSRGLVSTGLCAAHLAAIICNKQSPLTPELAASLSPARFLMRHLKRDPVHREVEPIR